MERAIEKLKLVVPLTRMVATNMGAGQHERALRATWTGAAVVAILTGVIGIVAAFAPGLWMDLFSTDPAVLAIGSSYLRVVGVCYSLFGLGLALFFVSQGAGRMFWPLAGSVARLVVVAFGGWLAVHVWQVPASGFFMVIAAGFVIYAVMIAGAIRLGTWVRA